MLKEGDQDDPVVDPIVGEMHQRREIRKGENSPEVRSQVNFEHLEESELNDRVAQGGGPNENTNIRDDDLHPMLRQEDHRIWVKIWNQSTSINTSWA